MRNEGKKTEREGGGGNKTCERERDVLRLRENVRL